MHWHRSRRCWPKRKAKTNSIGLDSAPSYGRDPPRKSLIVPCANRSLNCSKPLNRPNRAIARLKKDTIIGARRSSYCVKMRIPFGRQFHP
ncbi:hypothetical protein PGTUg99_009012 [Puccinia graminis f. sp. tritici]|uniref:Uncharacterized protein n=1 Tax=Puccinia graminis f. sp. tritici TaxID=56615 RepID=A0A5B0NBS8_PUCGR|nr:hypothetical protein PGTUg99_009012 [Puccinia graminis f. sp. tritici]